jgi:hypothetical protein
MRDGADVIKEVERVLANVPVFGLLRLRRWPTGARISAPSLPGAQSIFCFAVPMPQGIYGCAAKPLEMYWRALPMRFGRR